ncbi:hypothetical protein HKX48_006094 [Thoreauomyces humboldtii]|nr:hypothetical protein HKX48_006094 [Thoreauomyces humboldtii]
MRALSAQTHLDNQPDILTTMPPKKTQKQPTRAEKKRAPATVRSPALSSLSALPTDPAVAALDAAQRLLLQPHSPEQFMLNLICKAFDAHTLPTEDVAARLRIIKTLFFNRQYVTIFTDPTLLPVYASEYIPGRALCYRTMFMEVPELRELLEDPKGGLVYCLGAGNGSELLGIAGAMVGMERPEGSIPQPLTVHVQDLSSYGPVISSLESAIREHYRIPSSVLAVQESVSDLLVPTPEGLAALEANLSSAKLVTSLFLLNELLATNKSGFVKFISLVLKSMTPGSLFLVVDSAGSFSDVTVGQADYMVFHLLDAVAGFQAVVKEDSKWYRYPTDLKYPSKLNNMRYFLRLYRRV